MKDSKRNSKRTKRAKPDDRLIYHFHDGERDRAIDPLDVQIGLNSIDGFDLDLDSKLATGTSVEAPRALGRVIDAVRRVFRVKRFDEGGLTSGECMSLLYDFSLFILDLKKKLGISQTSSEPTAFLPDPSPTPNMSDSSQIADESKPIDPS